jgi:hypothetical protein
MTGSDAIKTEIHEAVQLGFRRVKGTPNIADASLLSSIEDEVLRWPHVIIGHLGSLSGVLAEVAVERGRQDELHGGLEAGCSARLGRVAGADRSLRRGGGCVADAVRRARRTANSL